LIRLTLAYYEKKSINETIFPMLFAAAGHNLPRNHNPVGIFPGAMSFMISIIIYQTLKRLSKLLVCILGDRFCTLVEKGLPNDLRGKHDQFPF